jgi:hypothetical protein
MQIYRTPAYPLRERDEHEVVAHQALVAFLGRVRGDDEPGTLPPASPDRADHVAPRPAEGALRSLGSSYCYECGDFRTHDLVVEARRPHAAAHHCRCRSCGHLSKPRPSDLTRSDLRAGRRRGRRADR